MIVLLIHHEISANMLCLSSRGCGLEDPMQLVLSRMLLDT